MKTEEIEYLDGEFAVNEQEPSTLQECVDIIGELSVVDETVSNLRYRNKYPRVYRLVSQAIAAEPYSFAKAVKETKLVGKEGAKTEKQILVSDMDHIRAFLQANEAENRATLQRLFEEIAPVQPLYVKGERTGGGGKIGQQALDTANSFFADGTVEEKITFIEATVPGYKVARDGDGSPTVESVARAIQALNRHLTKQALKQASQGLMGAGASA